LAPHLLRPADRLEQSRCEPVLFHGFANGHASLNVESVESLNVESLTVESPVTFYPPN